MTNAELRERLGEYFAPQGLYQKTKDMPFLGHVTCSTDTLTAGEWTEIVLDYEVGASGMADGAWFKATFKFYSDWALFQTADPAGANYVSAEYQAGPCVPGQSPATVQSLKVRFDQKGHERPFQKAVIVDTVDGYLKPGDHIVVFLRDGDPEFPFDRDGNVCRSFEWNEDMASDTIEPGAWPLEELWATYIHDPEGHLLFPHVGGRRCILDWHHPVLDSPTVRPSSWSSPERICSHRAASRGRSGGRSSSWPPTG